MQAEHKPSISVVIPLYNKGAFVERAIRSVLVQTFQDFEIIVVNDGSTDDGQAVVEAIHDSRIRLLHQTNTGVSTARNNGIAESHSDLISFLDADDEWMVTYLETVMHLRKKHPDAGVIATAYVRTDRQSGQAGMAIVRPELHSLVIRDYLRRSTGLLWTSAVSVRRDAIIRAGGFRAGYGRGEDIDLWMRLCVRYSVAYTPDVLAQWHVDATNRSPGRPECDISPVWLAAEEIAEATDVGRVNKRNAMTFASRHELGRCIHYAMMGHQDIARAITRQWRKRSGAISRLWIARVILRLPPWMLALVFPSAR